MQWIFIEKLSHGDSDYASNCHLASGEFHFATVNVLTPPETTVSEIASIRDRMKWKKKQNKKNKRSIYYRKVKPKT